MGLAQPSTNPEHCAPVTIPRSRWSTPTDSFTSPPPTGSVMTLFDGTSLANWRMAGRGTFHVIDGALQSVPSFDLGLLWCTIPMPQNFRLELDFFIRTN